MAALAGRRALVTGASAGIGAAIADCLARRGANLVLVARRRDRLDEVAHQLRTAHRIEVEVIVADLAATAAPAQVWAEACRDRPVDTLVNNAGFGHFRRFGSVAVEREHEQLRLNIEAVVNLSYRFVETHADRPGPAYLLNVSSIAAWQSTPNFATYTSSKVFVRNFSEALHYELRHRGVVVACLCPGGTRTDFHAEAGAGDYGRIANISMMSAGAVAEIGVRGLLRGKKIIIPGLMNKLACFGAGFAPRWLSSRASSYILGVPKSAALPARLSPPKVSSDP